MLAIETMDQVLPSNFEINNLSKEEFSFLVYCALRDGIEYERTSDNSISVESSFDYLVMKLYLKEYRDISEFNAKSN